MDAAIYKALSGAIAQMHRLEVAAQDLANVNTSGYKGQRLVFSEILANRSAGSERPGGLVAVGDQRTNFFQGEVQATGNPFHLAIEGDGACGTAELVALRIQRIPPKDVLHSPAFLRVVPRKCQCIGLAHFPCRRR